MKQSASEESYLHGLFDESEIKVCDILLDLGNLIRAAESSSKPPFEWGFKKRRSNIGSGNSAPRPSPKTSSPSLQRTCLDEREIKAKENAASPSTPLSFSPSESEAEKSKHCSRKKSKKKTREEWRGMIDGLTRRRELLRGEVETVRNYYSKLKTFNLELKAKKQEVLLSTCPKREEVPLEATKTVNSEMNFRHHYRTSVIPHQQALVIDPTVLGSEMRENFQRANFTQLTLFSPSNGLGLINHVSPLGIPDLNIGLEMAQPVVLSGAPPDNKVQAAEARRRRIIIRREMKARRK